MCDYGVTEGFAECSSLSHCFGNYTTLYEFDICLENNVHGNLHSMHAGLFNCAVSWKDWYDSNTWVTVNRLSFFANQIKKNMVDSQETIYTDYISCPTKCDLATDSYESCRCTADSSLGWD